MLQEKIYILFSKLSTSVHNVLDNVILWNGMTVQDIVIEANAEFCFFEFAELCFVEYAQVFMDEIGVRL